MAKMTNGCMVNIHRNLVFREINSLSTILSSIQHDIDTRMELDDDHQHILEDVQDYLEWIKENHG